MHLLFLLIQFLLLKTGQLPLKVARFTVDSLLWTVKKAVNLSIQIKQGVTARRRSWRVAAGAKRSRMHDRKPSWQDPEQWKKWKFPTVALPHFHHGRGRPRNSWLIPYYLNKFRLYFKKRVSKKTKIAFAFFLIIIMVFFYTSFILNAAYQLPSPDRLISSNQPLTTEFYDRSGKLLYRLYEGRNRSLVQLDELPQHLIDATIAIEDKNFYKHGGMDIEAIIRAAVHNFKNSSQEGASTITQQLIKNSLLTPEKTYARKIKEIILAIWAESKYSKKEILQMYFNETPYGGPTWGIKAAARAFFNKEPKDLTLAEASFLAGLPASPTQFSPYGSRPELGIERQKQVLQRMVEEKIITQYQMDQALAEKLNIQPSQDNIKAPHFVFYIKDLLSQIYGPRVVSQGGLKITTTLDLDLQQVVEKILSDEVNNLSTLNVQNGAGMVTDPKTGQILAMVGSKDFYEAKFGNFNVATSLRQPGSSIKPITYASAFKLGYTPGNTILDAPVTFRNEWGSSYSPVNYDGTFHGPVSIRQALGSSLNIPAVKMLATIGLPSMIQTAKDLGITTFTDPSRYGLSLTLGSTEVRLIEMMEAYGTFARGGKLNKPVGILKVTDSSGNVLEEYQQNEKWALSSQVAYLINSILSDNEARKIAFGLNSLLKFPGVAVKTGTSDNKRDNWTFGYTSDFVVGVWVGNNDNSPMDPRLTSGITGAAPIWNKITQVLLQIHPSLGFSQPEGINLVSIDGRSDFAISGNIPKGLTFVKKDDTKTIFSDSFSTYATQSAQQTSVKETSTN